MSLQDKRVVVTRAPHQAGVLVQLLREKGAVPIVYPCIDLAPPQDTAELDAALRNLKAYEWLLVTSSNTVLALKRRLAALQIEADLTRIKIAAVGPTTAESVEYDLGVSVALVPDEYTAQRLASALNVRERMRILLPQSAIAKPDLAKGLIQAGADVTVVTAYENVIGSDGEDVPRLLQEQRIDALSFTSGSTVENFVQRIKPQQAFDLPAACIGPRTVETARNCGFSDLIMPESYTLEEMLAALEQHLAN